MRKLILIAHTSLDGFVAGSKGELDGFHPDEENLQFVCEFTEDADTALFGRVSFKLLETYWPGAGELPSATKAQIAYSDWYNKTKKIVISKGLKHEKLRNTIILNDNISQEIQNIKKQEGKNILIFGSPSVSQFLIQHDLIDSFWIFVNPVIFGEGIPLFNGLNSSKRLQLLTTRQFQNGEMALNYTLNK